MSARHLHPINRIVLESSVFMHITAASIPSWP
jgi:hypothetical protein